MTPLFSRTKEQRPVVISKIHRSARLLLLGIAALTGCQPEQPITPAPLTFKLPLPVSTRISPSLGAIHAQLKIPELGVNESLIVKSGKAATQHPIGEFPQGRYTIQIVFEVDSAEFGRQVIAKGERKEDLGGRLKKIVFEYSDYTYPDSDEDHYNNLVELYQGHDPNDGNDAPRAARVFVTSSGGTANLSSWPDAGGKTGLAAGDAICQAHAKRAGLGGKWVAWLSNGETDAYCRVHDLGGKKSQACGQPRTPAEAGPWIRMDGYPFAPSITALTRDIEIYTPVIFDEFGHHFSDLSTPGKKLFFSYWTGTSKYGVGMKESGFYPEVVETTFGLDCLDWTSDSPELHSFSGTINASGPNWTEGLSAACDKIQSLLCLEVDKHVPLPQVRDRNKGLKAFVTSASGNGNLASWEAANGKTGIAAGDEICRALARDARLEHAERFKAFLGDDSTRAIDRLIADGPWIRLDGVPVAQSKQDFTRKIMSADPVIIGGGLFTSLSVNEHGEYNRDQFLNNQSAWTGTDWDGQTTPYHCSNWGSDNRDDLGVSSLTNWASWPWLMDPNIALSCDSEAAIYCFEDIQP